MHMIGKAQLYHTRPGAATAFYPRTVPQKANVKLYWANSFIIFSF